MCQISIFRTLCVISLVTFAKAKPNPEEKLEPETPRALIKDCSNGIFSASCLKLEALTLIEKLNNKEELRLFPGVSIVKEFNATDNAEVTASIAKSLESKDEKIDKFLLYKLGSYLDSHSVKLKLMDEDSSDAARALVEGRKGGGGGGGKKGGMGGMLAMAALMKGGMMSMAMGGLAMIAGKALVAALMSLLLSAIVGIKSMSGGQKSTTYEIVSKPIYSHSHSHSTGHEDVGSYGHGGGGWSGRSLGVRERRSIY